ncbi:MAG: FHA domain-containing protein [Nitrospiria bacterium]
MITSQQKVYSANFHTTDSVEPLLSNLKRKSDTQTAVLLFEGDQYPYILFIFQNTLYAAYQLNGCRFAPMPFSDYFNEMSHADGVLHLYHISPVLFKALLVMAQSEPYVVVPSDMTDDERLLGRLKQDEKEAVVVISRGEAVDCYYFKEGDLCDGYFENASKEMTRTELKTHFLGTTNFEQNGPASIAIYEGVSVFPASDQDAAEELIASITPSDDELWMKASEEGEKAFGGKPDENGGWSIEFLDGDRCGSTIEIIKKRISLGRGKMDIRLNDPQVSRYHADLERSAEGLIVSDRKSTNGLFVNNEKVAKKQISHNDVIRMGDTTMKVVYRT